jgi:hypothetical protein
MTTSLKLRRIRPVAKIAMICVVLTVVVTGPGTASASAVPIRPASNGKCLDVRYNSHYNGNVVWLWECNGTSAQTWNLSGAYGRYMIRDSAGYCLDAPAQYGGQWGHSVQIWSCNGGPQQIWDVWSSGYPNLVVFRNEAHGLCLDDYAWGNYNGATVVTWGCNWGANQLWGMRPDISL